MNRLKTIGGPILVAVILSMVLGISGCGKADDPWEHVQGGPTRVLVSFPPLYCFTKAVAGEHAAVMSLMTTEGPHHFQPTVVDSLKVNSADLFLVNGLELDDFVTKVVKSSRNRDVPIIKVGEALAKERLCPVAEHDHGEGHEGCNHGEFDPHVWLGIPEAITMVQCIRDALQKTDPTHKDAFQKNADAYIQKLNKLHEEGKDKLTGKKVRKFIATHDSFRYFCRSFQLEVAGCIQPRPGLDPDSQQMVKLIKMCEAHPGLRVIAFEPQYSADMAKALMENLRRKNRTDMEIIQVDPLETSPPDLEALGSDYYVDRMHANIDQLASALR